MKVLPHPDLEWQHASSASWQSEHVLDAQKKPTNLEQPSDLETEEIALFEILTAVRNEWISEQIWHGDRIEPERVLDEGFHWPLSWTIDND